MKRIIEISYATEKIETVREVLLWDKYQFLEIAKNWISLSLVSGDLEHL